MKVEEVAKEFAREVEPFTKRELIYEAKKPDIKYNMETFIYYNQATTFMGMWTHGVLKFEYDNSPGISTTRCKLLVPEGSIIMDFPPEDGSDDNCVSESAHDGSCVMRELIQTPIGQLNRFVWFTIRSVETNPVSLFYLKLGAEARKLHEMLEKRGITDPFVTDEVLLENGIQDPLMIHRCSNIWLGAEKFLKAKMI